MPMSTAQYAQVKSGARTPRQPPVRTDAGTATRAVTMASPPPIQSKDARRDGAVRCPVSTVLSNIRCGAWRQKWLHACPAGREAAPELDVDSAPHACPGQYSASNAPPDLPRQFESRLAHLDSGPVLAPWTEAPRYLGLPPHLCAASPADTLCGRTRSPGTGTEDAGRHSRVPVSRPVCASAGQAGRAARGDDRAVILGSRHAEKHSFRCRIVSRARARVAYQRSSPKEEIAARARARMCIRDCQRWASCVGAFAVRARATSLRAWRKETLALSSAPAMASCAHARGEGEPSQVSPGSSRAHARMGPTGAHRLADTDDARPAPACSACGPLRHRRSVAVDLSTGRLCIDSPGLAVARTYVLRFRIRTCARTLADDGSRFATGPRTGRAGTARGRQPHARAVRVESRGWCWGFRAGAPTRTGLSETTHTCARANTALAQRAFSLGNGMLAAGVDVRPRLYPHAPRTGREDAGAWLVVP
ncbi:predicted protein [Postia placenta Mad-698-R]|nr:predicted protein [Postia placenta Mad-698-R]